MKLLVSVTNEKEALEAIQGGAHIIDVKNPREGALGANFPRIIKRIRDIAPPSIEVSATIGDLPNLPGTASLAALGASACKVNYVKAGLFGVKTEDEAIKLMKEVCRAVKEFNRSIKIVAAGYADFKKIGSVNPRLLPKIAKKASAECVMIDVKEKSSGGLFNFFSESLLKKFVKEAHEEGLIVALAGSLGLEDVHRVYKIGADVIGVRKAVCTGEDRMRGKVTRRLVANFLKAIKEVEARRR